MKAWHVTAAGEQPRLGEVPVPEVTEGTVLIRVRAAGLNPLDNVLAAGMMAQMLPHEYPLVLGRDAAGVVEAVGVGVRHVKAGDKVFGHVMLVPPVRLGTLGEYALLPAASTALMPAGLEFSAAAALPLAAAAAAAAVDAIGPEAGQTVLINGASGGVGSYAIQLLAARKVTVIATGTAADQDRLRHRGADTVIDYTRGSVASAVRSQYPDGVDALINLAGNADEEVPLGAVRPGGKVAATTMVPTERALAAAGLTGTSVMAAPVRETTAPLAEQAAVGALVVDVASVLPFDQAGSGLAAVAAGGSRGKTVVLVG
jgi:NADPH:quinone reductase-like Zn-dependent oxidoreductase